MVQIETNDTESGEIVVLTGSLTRRDAEEEYQLYAAAIAQAGTQPRILFNLTGMIKWDTSFEAPLARRIAELITAQTAVAIARDGTDMPWRALCAVIDTFLEKEMMVYQEGITRLEVFNSVVEGTAWLRSAQ